MSPIQTTLPRLLPRALAVAAALACVALPAPRTPAAPGDELRRIPLELVGFGVSVDVDCDGNIYFTHVLSGPGVLHVIDAEGNAIDSFPTIDETGARRGIGEFAYDITRDVFWAAEFDPLGPPARIYTMSRTGELEFAFMASRTNTGLVDGVAYDGTDDTLWVSGDVSATIEHYELTDGDFIDSLTPRDEAGGTLGTISGVLVGVGDLLYLGRNGLAEIVTVRKSDGEFLSRFASPGGTRDEGLACDRVNFAPATALLSREFEGEIVAIEVEPDTCECGGGGVAPDCDAGGPYDAECSGGVVTVTVDGSASSDAEGEELSFDWATDCPGGTFDDPTAATTDLTLDGPPPCPVECTVTLTVMDASGESASCTSTVSVADTMPPSLSGVPEDLTLECGTPPPAPAGVTADDACAGPLPVSLSETSEPGGCGAESVLTRSWTATDPCGLSVQAEQTIAFVDTLPPELSGVPADETLECDEPVPPPAAVTASDTCEGALPVELEEITTPGRCADARTITRSWRAVDSCGHESVATQVIAIDDTRPPLVLAALEPLVPLPPEPPRSACSPPASRAVVIRCSATDACDPEPAIRAQVLVSNHEVTEEGECLERITPLPVSCDEVIEIRMVAAPCPAKPPKSPRHAASVISGRLVVFAERVVLEVTATDRCGNAASARVDPTLDPPPGCPEATTDGTCCPPLAPAPPRPCKEPACGEPPTSAP